MNKKRCSKCKIKKSLNQFYVADKNTGRLQPHCKSCIGKNTLKHDRKSKLKKLYNMTLAEYDKLFESQGGVCAICGKEQSTRRLDVDHDHKTGRIRGLLCHNCNTSIGLLCEDIQTLQSAINYLKESKKHTQ